MAETTAFSPHNAGGSGSPIGRFSFAAAFRVIGSCLIPGFLFPGQKSGRSLSRPAAFCPLRRKIQPTRLPDLLVRRIRRFLRFRASGVRWPMEFRVFLAPCFQFVQNRPQRRVRCQQRRFHRLLKRFLRCLQGFTRRLNLRVLHRFFTRRLQFFTFLGRQFCKRTFPFRSFKFRLVGRAGTGACVLRE